MEFSAVIVEIYNSKGPMVYADLNKDSCTILFLFDYLIFGLAAGISCQRGIVFRKKWAFRVSHKLQLRFSTV